MPNAVSRQLIFLAHCTRRDRAKVIISMRQRSAVTASACKRVPWAVARSVVFSGQHPRLATIAVSPRPFSVSGSIPCSWL